MLVYTGNQFVGHTIGTFLIIQVTTGRTETAFQVKGANLRFPQSGQHLKAPRY